MPKDVKDKIYQQIWDKKMDRNYDEQLRKQAQKDIIDKFVKAYGYDVKKHQPNVKNGKIDIKILQAYI